jgi:hypothetical protein
MAVSGVDITISYFGFLKATIASFFSIHDRQLGPLFRLLERGFPGTTGDLGLW